MSGLSSGGLSLGLLLLLSQGVTARAVDTGLPAPTASPTPAACVGDCNGDGVVTVNELILGVNIALGTTPVTACPAFDPNHDGMVTINELITGVNNALYGCGVTPPTPLSTPTQTATASASLTPSATDTATRPPLNTPTVTPSPSPTRTVVPTKTATRTPTIPMSVCGGFVSTLPVLCNLTVLPNPVSRSGTIAFRFGVSDLNGDITRICITLTHPPLEPETRCTAFVPTNRVINAILSTAPESASPLAFGTYNAAMQAIDNQGNQSNIITATFQVQ